MEFLFFIFPLLLIFGTHKAFVAPFLSGKMEIDRGTFPMLARAQRILRARDIKAREKELKLREIERKQKTQQAVLAIETKTKEIVAITKEAHRLEVTQWTQQFLELDRKRALELDAELYRQRAEEKAKAKQELEGMIRERWRSDEAQYNIRAKAWSSQPADDDDNGYSSRMTNMDKPLSLRESPTTKSRRWGTLNSGLRISVDGWIYGEPLPDPRTGDHNNIWFKLRNSEGAIIYLWSGGVTDSGTRGIPNLNLAAELTGISLFQDLNGRRFAIHGSEDYREFKKWELVREMELLNKRIEKLPKSLNLTHHQNP